MSKHNMRIFGVSSFSSYKTTLKHQLNGEKWDVGFYTYLPLAELFCYVVLVSSILKARLAFN